MIFPVVALFLFLAPQSIPFPGPGMPAAGTALHWSTLTAGQWAALSPGSWSTLLP